MNIDSFTDDIVNFMRDALDDADEIEETKTINDNEISIVGKTFWFIHPRDKQDCFKHLIFKSNWYSYTNVCFDTGCNTRRSIITSACDPDKKQCILCPSR